MAANRQSDEFLMRQVARGDREQVEVLVRRYANPLLMFIERMIGDRHRSEELVQEVFLLMWKKRLLYRASCPFKPWLYKIALNCCRAEYRSHRAPTVRLEEEGALALDSGSPLELAVASETAVHVLAAVERLSVRQRTVVVLRIWNGMSYAQIGEITDRPEVTVRSTMHYALANVRKYLEPRLK